MKGKTAKYMAILALLLATACGNSLTGPQEAQTSLKFEHTPDNIETTIDAQSSDISITAECRAEDLFEGTCYISEATIDIPGVVSTVFPIGKNLKSGEKMTMTIPLFNASLSELEPYSYLHDLNPSTSSSQWTIYSEVIGKLQTSSAGRGGETCTTDPADPAAAPVCTPDTEFSTTIPPYTAGALTITDGKQKVSETDFGALTGDGTGKIRDNLAQWQYASAPLKGSYITAMFLGTIKNLSNVPRADDLKITYDNLTLTQAGNLLNDASGQTYAAINGTAITVIRPMGYKPAPMVATYSGEPFNAYGGEKVGLADGISKQYTLRTQYPLLLEGSLSAFTATQPGTIKAYDKNGQFIVTFNAAPKAGEPIKASYIITNVTRAVQITINGIPNGTTITIPLSVGRVTQ